MQNKSSIEEQKTTKKTERSRKAAEKYWEKRRQKRKTSKWQEQHFTYVYMIIVYLVLVSCFNKIQIGFTFLVPAHPGSPGKGDVNLVCVCVLFCCNV